MQPSKDKPDMAFVVRQFREKHGLTLAQLACALNMQRPMTVHDWEAGRAEPPPFLPLALEQVALKLGCQKGFRTHIMLNAK